MIFLIRNHFYVSDISDTGLMGLCGISLDQPELMDDSASADETSTSFGCPLLTRLGVTDCQHISHAGVKQAKKLIVGGKKLTVSQFSKDKGLLANLFPSLDLAASSSW